MLGISVSKGTSRLVFLLSQKYALKIARPRLREAWHYKRCQEVLEGIKANMSERKRWESSKDKRLCPILFCDYFGIVVVMPYARPLTDEEFHDLEYKYIMEGSHAFGRVHHGDFKRENYGMLGNQIVKIDYEE
jgi:hypothetical protein